MSTDFNSLIQKAERYKARARVALYGPSGGGKSYTGLMIGSTFAQLGGSVLTAVDTEKGSLLKYAPAAGKQPSEGEFSFDHMPFDAPYDVDQLIAFFRWINTQPDRGVVLVDSLSHFWFGAGGLLDLKDKFAATSRYDSFTAWKPVMAKYNELVEAIIGCTAHVFVTLRAKHEYSRDQNSKGKTTIKRVGTAPVFRDDFIYELDVTIKMNLGALAEVDKTRYKPFEGLIVDKPTESFIHPFYYWLDGSDQDPYSYGSGQSVPFSQTTRRIFNQYRSANEGKVPFDGDALKSWYAENVNSQNAKPDPFAVDPDLVPVSYEQVYGKAKEMVIVEPLGPIEPLPSQPETAPELATETVK